MVPEIIKTADGSDTIYLSDIDEHYHSVNGAIDESMHVYVEAGFNYCKTHPVTIFEVGFGTGLNAYLTAIRSAEENRKTTYISIEKFPLERAIINQLNYARTEGKNGEAIFEDIHSAEWGNRVRISNYFDLIKIEGDLLSDIIDISADIVYFDAFAFNKQPEMWSYEVLEKTCRTLGSGGIFVTYSARGELKRNLRSLGFDVTLLPGAKGKREMIRGIKK